MQNPKLNLVCSFFLQTADVYSLILLTQLIFIVLHMTCSVFQMDMVIHKSSILSCLYFAFFILFFYWIIYLFVPNQAMKHPDLNFFMILMSLLVSSANLYFYCYYGNRSTNDFAQMAQLLFESNWNEQSVEIQKFFKMMISNAQRPLFYHGFHIVHLNLETYLKVSFCRRKIGMLMHK